MFVLGEVSKPLVVTLKPGVTLIEAIAMAGGFTRDAELKNVFIVRGGLGNPKLLQSMHTQSRKKELLRICCYKLVISFMFRKL